MSRNGSGVYSLPGGSTVTNGDTSDASDINTPLADLEADMNIPRPIVAGGTGASSAAQALINLGLTATAAEINALDGITATVAELNVLDGIPGTLTATELGYVDGVTSAIQTQLNARPLTPQVASGVGQWVVVISGSGSALVLPAGGTWAWFAISSDASTVTDGAAFVSAGGATVISAVPGVNHRAFAWRIA